MTNPIATATAGKTLVKAETPVFIALPFVIFLTEENDLPTPVEKLPSFSFLALKGVVLFPLPLTLSLCI